MTDVVSLDLGREAWRLTPAGYASTLTGGEWQWEPHLDYASLAITETIRVGGKLAIFEPPRHGKSELVDVWTPTYFLDRFPHKRVMLATYEERFGAEWGGKVRDVINQKRDYLRVRIKGGERAASRIWSTTAGGGMITGGIDSAFTGRGADLFVFDDPYKNWRDAHSIAYRKMVMEFWRSTARLRLEPGAAVILIMTRWHEDDFGGYVSKRKDWNVIRLPALAERDDPLGRAEGDPLWRDRYDRAALDAIRDESGEYFWAGMYQQRPAPEEGGIVRRSWFRYWKPRDRITDRERREGILELPPRLDDLVTSWDMSFKKTTEGSFVVGQTWGKLGAHHYALDQVRDRWEYVDAKRQVEDRYARWPQATARLVEEAANGPAIISDLQSVVPALIPINPKDSKEARLRSISPMIQAGNVILPHPDIAPWVESFVEEVCAFPNASHDDQVDAMTQALLWWELRPIELVYETWEPEVISPV